MPADVPTGAPATDPRTPRVPPLPEAEWSETLRAVVASAGPLNVFTTLGRHAQLFDAWIGLGSMLLLGGTLSGRVRELAILRSAHLRSCAYEWDHHRELALSAGITEAEIAALRLDRGAHPWDGLDRAVVTAADELHATGTLGDEAWNALAAHLGERELIELVVLIGHYHMVAFALNAMRVQPEGDH
jgi:AhpD family alkylhydroperoxidase